MKRKTLAADIFQLLVPIAQQWEALRKAGMWYLLSSSNLGQLALCTLQHYNY